MSEPVLITYLRMESPEQLLRAPEVAGFSLRRLEPPEPALNARLYREVGAGYRWHDRLGWSEQEWSRYAHRPALHTWLGELEGALAGYFELLEHEDRSVELAYFGLLPGFLGRGLGGALLTGALERAWALGPERVWVHTCTLDHPAALPNYQARGMRVFKQVPRIEENS